MILIRVVAGINYFSNFPSFCQFDRWQKFFYLVMILIVSTSDDKATKNVAKWISYLGGSFIRINETDSVYLIEILQNDQNLSIKLEVRNWNNEKKVVWLSKIDSFWYRRGRINLTWLEVQSEKINSKTAHQINKFLFNEAGKIEELLYHRLCQKKHINKYIDISTNKIKNCYLASKYGIKTPLTFLSSFKPLIADFIASNTKVITKAIHLGFVPLVEKLTSIYGMTNVVNIDEITINENPIFPSLLQGYIEKEYELRVFYLNGNFYPSAIFSQADTQTTIDFRNYNYDKQNRVVPFKIPAEIEVSLTNLCKEIDINSGSIDMIVDKVGNHIFLEINPIGQFEQISIPCNFYLEKKIAQHLI